MAENMSANRVIRASRSCLLIALLGGDPKQRPSAFVATALGRGHGRFNSMILEIQIDDIGVKAYFDEYGNMNRHEKGAPIMDPKLPVGVIGAFRPQRTSFCGGERSLVFDAADTVGASCMLQGGRQRLLSGLRNAWRRRRQVWPPQSQKARQCQGRAFSFLALLRARSCLGAALKSIPCDMSQLAIPLGHPHLGPMVGGWSRGLMQRSQIFFTIRQYPNTTIIPAPSVRSYLHVPTLPYFHVRIYKRFRA
jgi:hypothetical protein